MRLASSSRRVKVAANFMTARTTLPPLTTEPIPLKCDAEGVIRVAETRVRLDTVVFAFKAGATAEEIVQQYPSLTLSDVYAVLTYYLRHQAEVDAYLAGREAEAARCRAENQSRFPSQGIRERLLARRTLPAA